MCMYIHICTYTHSRNVTHQLDQSSHALQQYFVMYSSVQQCVTMCLQHMCSVLRRVCNVLQCAAVCCSVLKRDAVCCSVMQCLAECCSVLQCVAACRSVLQCVAVCCSALQCAAVCCSDLLYSIHTSVYSHAPQHHT